MIGKHSTSFNHNQPGFTLIEMVIALMINIVLAAIILPAISNYREAAVESACKSNQKSLGVAEEAFRLERMTYLAVTDWSGPGKHLLDYIQGKSEEKRRCPKTGLDYIISAVTDIRNDYKIVCRTVAHDWQVRTGATLIRGRH